MNRDRSLTLLTLAAALAATSFPRLARAEITTTGSYLLHQAVANVEGGPEDSDRFGDEVASGDFNGDGFADLVVGIPGEDVGSLNAAGAVQIFPGGASGFSGAADRILHQDTPASGGNPAMAGVAEAGDRFGEVLEVGDFDGDGFDDLAIGVPGEDVDTNTNAGAVWILFGSASGLTTSGQVVLDQNLHAPFVDSAESGDGYGSALAAGDFDGDGDDDLAVGVPGENLLGFGLDDAGVIHIYSGPNFDPNRDFEQGENDPTEGDFDPTPAETPEGGDRFGAELAAGDFDGDGREDLAIGAPGEDHRGKVDGGIIEVLFGSDIIDLIEPHRSVLLHQDRAGSPGEVEGFDFFGTEIAVGDFDGDDVADLVVGMREENIGTNTDAGAITVYFGPLSEISSLTAQFFSQDDPAAIAGAAELNDHFGESLAVGDFDADGFDDLAIGVPDEDVGTVQNAGAFHVLYGRASGLGSSRNQLLDQDSAGVLNTADTNDRFGAALAAGDFDGDGVDDLAVSSPTEEVAGEASDHGVAFVFSGD